MDSAKPAGLSKTIWFNMLAGVAWLVTLVVDASAAGNVPDGWEPIAGLLQVLGNLYLRYLTSGAISLPTFNLFGLLPFVRPTPPPPTDDTPTPAAIHAGDTKSVPTIFPPAAVWFAPFLLLTLATACLAAPPQARISGPSGGVPGDKIVLTFDESVGDVFRVDVIRRGYRAEDTHYEVAPDGRSVEIYSYPGVYDVTLTVANEDGIDRRLKTVIIWGSSPPAPLPEPDPLPPDPVPPTPNPPQPNPPAPEPEPIPPEPVPPEPLPPAPIPPEPVPPEPDLPDGPFGVAEEVLNWAGDVDSPTRRRDARQIVQELRSVQAAIAATSLRGTTSIVNELKDRLSDKSFSPAWAIVFGARLAALVFRLIQSGDLTSPDDWLALLEEIIAALTFFADGS